MPRSLVPTVAAAALAVAAPVATAASWTAPVEVMSEAPARYPDAGTPAVAVRADGVAFVAWGSATGGLMREVRIATRRPGRPFARPVSVGRTKYRRVTPSVSAAGSTVAVAWTSRARTRDADALRVWLSRPGRAATIDGPKAPAAAWDPKIAVTPAGEVLAVWTEGRGSVARTAWWGVRAAGGTWSRTRLDPSRSVDNLDVASRADGAAVAVYRASRPATGALYSAPWSVMAAYRPPGGVFSAPEDLDAPETDVIAAAMRPGGAPAAVLAAGDALRAISRGAVGWAAPVAVGEGAAAARVGVTPDGRLLAVWKSDGIRFAEERAPGGPWTAPQDLGGAGADLAGDLALTVGSRGRAVVAWSAPGRDFGSRVHAAVREAGASTWPKAVTVGPPGRRCQTPAAAVSPSGRVVLAFVCRRRDGRDALLVRESPPA